MQKRQTLFRTSPAVVHIPRCCWLACSGGTETHVVMRREKSKRHVRRIDSPNTVTHSEKGCITQWNPWHALRRRCVYIFPFCLKPFLVSTHSASWPPAINSAVKTEMQTAAAAITFHALAVGVFWALQSLVQQGMFTDLWPATKTGPVCFSTDGWGTCLTHLLPHERLQKQVPLGACGSWIALPEKISSEWTTDGQFIDNSIGMKVAQRWLARISCVLIYLHTNIVSV